MQGMSGNEGTKPAVDIRFTLRTKPALRSWLLDNGPSRLIVFVKKEFPDMLGIGKVCNDKKAILNGKCLARGQRKLSGAAAKLGTPDFINTPLLFVFLFIVFVLT